MPERPSLKAEKRSLAGRKVKKLRRQAILPANVFGKKIASQSLQVSQSDFTQLYRQVGETGLVDLLVGSQTLPVLITNVHLDPVTDAPLHVDFHHVNLSEVVTVDIPVDIVGESPAVKEKGGILEVTLTEIEVEALPTDLPEKITVDISSLKEIGDTIKVGDIKLPSKLTVKTAADAPIVITSQAKEEVVETPPPTTPEAATTPPDATSPTDSESTPDSSSPSPEPANPSKK